MLHFVNVPPVPLLFYGDDHPSLPIFPCPSRTSDHLTHTSQPKNSSIQGSEHFRSDDIASANRQPSVLTAWKTFAALMIFSSPKYTSCLSDGVVVTGFKKSLKHCLHLVKTYSSLLRKTPIWSLMDLSGTVVLNLSYRIHRFNCYSQIKSPLRNLVCKEHFYISTLRRETKLFTTDKLFGL